jgi:hypothetical protein
MEIAGSKPCREAAGVGRAPGATVKIGVWTIAEQKKAAMGTAGAKKEAAMGVAVAKIGAAMGTAVAA